MQPLPAGKVSGTALATSRSLVTAGDHTSAAGGTRMTAPLIGITTDMGAAAWHDRVRAATRAPAAYSRPIERAGAVPVLLPPVLTGGSGRLAAGLDALIFAGGADLDPRCYGATLDDQVAGWPDCARDAVELELMRAAMETGTPFLAICRGLQGLKVPGGGTPVNDQPDPAGHGRDLSRSAELPGLDVRISPDSRLGGILGASVK